jgi:hypothetical protein
MNKLEAKDDRDASMLSSGGSPEGSGFAGGQKHLRPNGPHVTSMMKIPQHNPSVPRFLHCDMSCGAVPSSPRGMSSTLFCLMPKITICSANHKYVEHNATVVTSAKSMMHGNVNSGSLSPGLIVDISNKRKSGRVAQQSAHCYL